MIGKFGGECSEAKPDTGHWMRTGHVDSSEAFAAFIDDLDNEIERLEEKLGRKLGIPLVLSKGYGPRYHIRIEPR